MADILDNKNRYGCITSSQSYLIMGAPKPKATYLEKLRFERKLKRSVDLGKSTNSTNWGLFLEQFVHKALSIEYITDAQTTINHPFIPYWKGSPDTTAPSLNVVADIKCFEPLNFCQYLDCLERTKESNDLEIFKKEFSKEFWQLISNSILTKMSKIQVILYMPYEKDMEDIRNEAAAYDDYDAYKYRFIYELPNNKLACLPDDSEYKDLNIFTFDNIESYQKELTNAVLECGKLIGADPIEVDSAHSHLVVEVS